MTKKIEEILSKIWKEITGMKGEINGMKGEIREIKSTMATKQQLKFFKQYFEEEIEDIKANMVTKKDHINLLSIVDSMAKDAKEARREQLLFAGQFVDLDDQVANHEKRLRILETPSNTP